MLKVKKLNKDRDRTFLFDYYYEIDDKRKKDAYKDNIGYRDLSNPHFQSTYDIGLFHDFFEHNKREKESIENELKAFGRILFLRIETGIIISNKFDVLGIDLHSLFQNYEDYNIPFKESRKIKSTEDSEWAEKAIQTSLKEFLKMVISDDKERYSGLEDYINLPHEALIIKLEELELHTLCYYIKHITYWILKGYNNAKAIYEDLYYEVDLLFLVREFKKIIINIEKNSKLNDKLYIHYSSEEQSIKFIHKRKERNKYENVSINKLYLN